MAKRFFYLVLLAAVFGAVGCAKQELVGPKQAYKSNEAASIPENTAKVVFYRKKQGLKDRPASPVVSINGRVVGALNPDQYMESYVCAGEGLFKVQQQEASRFDKTYSYDAAHQETLYFEVRTNEEGQYDIFAIPEERALSDLQKVKRTSFLANRSMSDCAMLVEDEEIEDRDEGPVLIDESVLEVDGLFGFDSAVLRRMDDSADAFEALNNTVAELKELEDQVQKVRVVGHTDRLGAKAYNKALSERRAKAVADYLIAKGVKQELEVVGVGAEQPITTNCKGTRATAALIECLQPDRRVSLELWGLSQ